MEFYYAPGSSSLATHIMLREAGADFHPRKVDIFTHTLDDGSDYRVVNPNGYVPAIVLDEGRVVTESAAILDWLAGRAGTVSSNDEEGRLRHLQLLAFMSSELHKQFIPLFFTQDGQEAAQLRQVLEPRLRWIGDHAKGTYLLGDRFTGADAMFYVLLRWADMTGVSCQSGSGRFIEAVERREAVRSALAFEGLEPLREAV